MPTPDLPQTEAAIIEMTNQFRKEQGLSAVVPDVVLRKAAESYARYLARTDKFSHTADGRQPHERAKAVGYDYCIVSENLALNLDSRGFETRQLARDAVEGWKNSPGHRKNMVMKEVTQIAVAIAKAPSEEKYLSVQLFGRPASLKYDFKITNESPLTVTYSVAGEKHEIKPRVIITHTICKPETVLVERAGGFFDGQKLSIKLEPKSGDAFLIRPPSSGSKLPIEIDRTGR